MDRDKSMDEKGDENTPESLKKDYELAQLLASGDGEVWEDFYERHKGDMKRYIGIIGTKIDRYFDSDEIEEILHMVYFRIVNNNFKVLREYRGDCPLGKYISKQINWAVIDYLRYRGGYRTVSIENCASNKDGDSKGLEIKDTKNNPQEELIEKEEILSGRLPEAIFTLNENHRQAFLLRYYDYFGFPLQERRNLARKRGISIRELNEEIIRLLDTPNRDLLERRRAERSMLEAKLTELFHKIQYLKNKHQLEQEEKDELDKLIEKRQELLRQWKEELGIVETPYNIIAQIMGENTNTIRSWVMRAKEALKKKYKEKV